MDLEPGWRRWNKLSGASSSECSEWVTTAPRPRRRGARSPTDHACKERCAEGAARGLMPRAPSAVQASYDIRTAGGISEHLASRSDSLLSPALPVTRPSIRSFHGARGFIQGDAHWQMWAVRVSDRRSWARAEPACLRSPDPQPCHRSEGGGSCSILSSETSPKIWLHRGLCESRKGIVDAGRRVGRAWLLRSGVG